MAVEKKIEALEGEFKLLKGEVKQTLTDVRDFLTALKLPAAEDEEAKLFGMEGGGVVAEGKPPMEINLNTSPSSQAPPNHPAGAPAAVYDDRGTSPRKVAEPSTVRTEYVAEVPPSSESPEDDEASLPSDETADERG
ncbi:MAG: hypothetical protein V1780_03970 [Chloroflexota bacterium]